MLWFLSSHKKRRLNLRYSGGSEVILNVVDVENVDSLSIQIVVYTKKEPDSTEVNLKNIIKVLNVNSIAAEEKGVVVDYVVEVKIIIRTFNLQGKVGTKHQT